jgi:integrase/recombinase XerD
MARLVPGDPHDPDGMPALVAAFCESMLVRGYSPRTIDAYQDSLARLADWLADRGVERPAEVSLPMLEHYQRALFHHRRADGAPLTFRTQLARLTPVRTWFRWLARHRRIASNPAADLELPKVQRYLPRAVLTVAEVEAVMSIPNLGEPRGVRDRAIMEVLYSTAMRGAELAGLAVDDLDIANETVLIRHGKGRKGRLVPIGDRAIVWCEKYLASSRSWFAVPPDDGWLFLNTRGGPINPHKLGYLVRAYFNAAGITKPGASHLFRHTAATLMLEGGADVRFIQALLGHAEISSTQIYTQVAIRALKAVHTASHPGATNDPRRRVALPREEDTAVLRARLFAALDAETGEDPDGDFVLDDLDDDT